MRKLLIPLISSLLFTGCQTSHPTMKKEQSLTIKPISPQSTQPMSLASEAASQSCAKELFALHQVNPALSNLNAAKLNQTLKQAEIYLKIRDNIDKNTAVIMDSAYKYKISKQCNEIKNALTNTLIDTFNDSPPTESKLLLKH
ncbi:hypothetical protein ACSJL3_005169 (plasmid) [Serratia nevei]|uniref:hypothetical protein n=1 Tax=Serratia nevei TaxID=2703794 RepID=UPI003F6D072F